MTEVSSVYVVSSAYEVRSLWGSYGGLPIAIFPNQPLYMCLSLISHSFAILK